MDGLLGLLQQGITYFSGNFAILATTLAVTTCFLLSMPPIRVVPVGYGVIALILGAAAVTAGYFTGWIGGGGGAI